MSASVVSTSYQRHGPRSSAGWNPMTCSPASGLYGTMRGYPGRGATSCPALEVAEAKRLYGQFARLRTLSGLRMEWQGGRQRRRDARQAAAVAGIRTGRISAGPSAGGYVVLCVEGRGRSDARRRHVAEEFAPDRFVVSRDRARSEIDSAGSADHVCRRPRHRAFEPIDVPGSPERLDAALGVEEVFTDGERRRVDVRATDRRECGGDLGRIRDGRRLSDRASVSRNGHNVELNLEAARSDEPVERAR